MTSYYLDASVALRALLGHSRSAAEWIDRLSADPKHELISSRLLRTEPTRVLRREQLPVALRDEVLDVLALIPVAEARAPGAAPTWAASAQPSRGPRASSLGRE